MMRQRLLADFTRHSGRYTFLHPVAGNVEGIVKTFDDDGDYFTITGRAVDSDNSEFMLKADAGNVYGWLVYRDRKIAYEYTTNAAGIVEVEQVPLEKIFAVCDVPEPDIYGPLTAEKSALLTDEVVNAGEFPGHVGAYPAGTDIMKLQSRPGAPKLWYINFTDTVNGSEPKTGHTKADIFQSWAITAATLWSFNINVTTDPAVYAATPVANTGCSTVTYANMNASSFCGINIFGSRSCCTDRIYRNGYGTGRIINHEAGHGWGMRHDGGSPGGEYFTGFSGFKWTPLMGNVWPGDSWGEEALYQYSKGEYDTATDKGDDFAAINKKLEYMPDDIAATRMLDIQGGMVKRETNWGQIHRNTDTDSFAFKVGAGGGKATLKIVRIEDKGGSMLDVDASIVDSTGKEVAQNNPMAARYANLTADLPAGDYTLVVKGGAEGTPQKGFSTYSSVGLYAIEGSVTNGMGMGGGSGGAGGGGAGTGGSGVGGAGGTTGSGGATGTGGSGSGGRAGTGGRGGATGTGGSGSGGTVGTGGAGTGGTIVVGTGGSTVGTGGSTVGTGGQVTTGTGGKPGTGGSGTPITPTEPTGCACSTAGNASGGLGLASLLAGVGMVSLLRRRRRG